MSRIGKQPIILPEKVEVSITNNTVKVTGPLWELTFSFADCVSVKKNEDTLIVEKLNESGKALWWTTRAVIQNMVIWVSEGYKKTLEINGVGYKFEVSGNTLILSIGYSHKVELSVPEGLKVMLDEKHKNTLYITGIDKQRVGEFAAMVRAKKKPEPYKGKWIKYAGEHIIRKAGKSAGK